MPEHQTKNDTIVVNGTQHEWPKNGEISYEEVVKLAFPNFNPKNTYSVIYKRGQGNKPEGILPPGGTVKVKDGMIFNVSENTQS